MEKMSDTLALIGRVLLAYLFIPAGAAKMVAFEGSVVYAASAGMPLPELGVALGLVIELVGGILLLIGWKTRYASAVLAFFTVVAAFTFHAFWSLPVEQAALQEILFNKDVAIVGGLLAFTAFGAGAWSWDAKR